MRSSLRAASLALIPLAVGAASMSAQSVKIGYINSAAILAQAPGRAEAEAQFDKEVGAYRETLALLNDSLNTLAAAFDRDAPKLDSVTRETRGKAIRDREAAYQARARALDSTMQDRQAQLVKPIMERVQAVIESIRADEGYSFILDVGSQASVVVAADKKLDLTDKVLAKLKATATTATPTRPLVPQPAGVIRH